MAENVFDTMKSKINRGITTVTVKTSSSVERAKINTHMETVKAEMERLKQELGNKMFILWEADSFELSKIEADLQKIKEKKEALGELQNQLEVMEGQIQSILGTEPVTEYYRQAGCVCSQCGSQYEQTINFCVKCGSKIE